MDEFYRAYAQVDLGAIRHNIKEARRNINKETKIMAIVKANAYGHGAIEVADTLKDLVDAYGVAMIEEAIELRNAGVDKMILILGYSAPTVFKEIVSYDISQTVFEYELAKMLSDEAVAQGKKAKIHIKLDTGMGRIGFKPTKENAEVVKLISELPGIEIEGIFTHFARADEETIEPAKEPFEKYQTFITYLDELGVSIPIHHVSNSASIIGFKEANLNMVRSGITTYGLYPSHEVKKDVLKLQPAMQLKSHISYLKEVDPGTPIGYGGTFVTERTSVIATIPIGYADGMKRDLSNKASVLIHGTLAPIVGRICMDQFMVDVTDLNEVKEGDIVTIFGEDEGAFLSMDEVSEQAHSFSYEFACSISGRIPRKYINRTE